MRSTRSRVTPTCRHETYLEWNIVPFSKYPSWCTSMMSPYFDFRWQRKGLCRTSISTSASGSFPPLTDSSRQEQSQLSTVSNMLPRSENVENSSRTNSNTHTHTQVSTQLQKACRWSSTWQGSDVVQVVAGRFLVIGCISPPNAAHRRSLSHRLGEWALTSVRLIFISVQRFMKFTVMQKDYWLAIFKLIIFHRIIWPFSCNWAVLSCCYNTH